MSDTNLSKRRWLLGALATGSAWLLAGCDKLGETAGFQKMLGLGETLSKTTHKLIGRRAMAQEFTEADLSPGFRGNGNTDPDNEDYKALAKAGFANWALDINGLVEQRQSSRWRNSKRCLHAHKSRGTIVSKAGAR